MKKILVTKPSIPSYLKVIFGFCCVLISRNLTNNGVNHQNLSGKLKDYLDSDNLTLFSNGHLALEAALEMLGLEGGEIITTPFTFASTTHAIVRKGFTPVFCDIDRYNYTIDHDLIESLITDRTVAILPVHVYGNVCNLKAIEDISKKHNIPVIYDSAHAFGVKYNLVPISSYGDFNMFSFHATKVFHTVEGGALTYKDSVFSAPIEATKNFGIGTNGDVLYAGGNAKMNEFQAVIGLANLSNIHKYIKRRKVISLEYSKHFKDVEGLEICEPDKEVESNYSYYPILITKPHKNSSELIDYLSKFNIIARRYFYPLTSDFSAYNKQYDSNKTPVAKYVSEKVLCLPIYDSLRMSDVKRVILKVKEYMQT